MKYKEAIHIIRKIFLIISLIFLIPAFFVLLWCTVTPFYYSLIVGSFGAFLLVGILLLYIISMLFFMLTYRGKRIIRFLPLIFLGICALFSFSLPTFDLDVWFALNKSKFERVEYLLKENPNLKGVSNFRRHLKSINNLTIEGDFEITKKEDIAKRFNEIIKKDTLNLDAIYEIRNLIDELHVCFLENHNEYTIYIIDGFIDNEYGIIKFKNNVRIPKEGEHIKYSRLLTSMRKITGSFYYWACT